MRRLLVLALASSALAACDSGPCGEEPNQLRGSVDELYDIEVDRVRARRAGEDTVTIEYLHGENVVAKVVADVRSFREGAAFPLRDGSVYRVTSPPTDFPEDVLAGAITFESPLEDGEDVAGCFNVKFAMENGEQRTLAGAFEAKLELGI